MVEQWIALADLPLAGASYTVDNPTVWASPIAEYQVEARVLSPLCCALFLLPQEEGCLIRGHLQGGVVVPCNRCAEDVSIQIDHTFETFEPYPDESFDKQGGTHGQKAQERFSTDVDELIIRQVKGTYELNAAGLAWEEFLMCLPINPLCSDTCKGLCPVCGKNQNEALCQCSDDTADPRLAALRNIRINK